MEVDLFQSQSTSAGITVRPSSTFASAASSAAHSIIDELADRDRLKKNIIIYNLPEATDHAADKVSFPSLCKTVLKQAQTLIGYMKKTKRLLFLIQMCCIITNQFERVFIASDRTKFEWEKHVKLVNELKERKAKRETNLIIINGCIIFRPTRIANNPPCRGIDHSSQSS